MVAMAGKAPTDGGAARQLLHFLIVLANDKGQPQGQTLLDDSEEAGSSGSSNEAGELEIPPNAKKQRKTFSIDDVVQRVAALENVDRVKEKRDEVRLLRLHNTPSESLILLKLEELARLGRKTRHLEADMFEELARQASRLQGKISLSSLLLAVLGGQGADVVSKAITKCLREGQAEKARREPEALPKRESEVPPVGVRQESPVAGLYQQAAPYNPGYQYAPFPPPFPMMAPQTGGYHPAQAYQYQSAQPYQPYGSGNGRYNQGQYRSNGDNNTRRPKGACHFCDSPDHQVKNCSRMKAAKGK